MTTIPRRLNSTQRRALRRYERLLELAGLSAAITLKRGEQEPEAITPSLNSMCDQIVRSAVVSEYTMSDEHLNHEISAHFFSRGHRLRKARRSKRYRTLELVLQQTYLLQKLSLVQSFRKVPDRVTSHIRALNDLRNGLAHTFFLDPLPKAKRTFKGRDVFSVEGFAFFREAMREVDHFFLPFLTKIYPPEEAPGV